MSTSGRARTRRAAAALAIAGGVHLAAIGVLEHVPWFGWRLRLPAMFTRPLPTASPPLDIEAIDLVQVTVPALAYETVMGTSDAIGLTGTHPMPRASADLPGQRAADRGGGATGGPATWTGRRDKLDDVALRAETWNGGIDYRTAHRDVDRSARSPEALKRQEERDYGDRQAQRLASAGEPTASLGEATGVGAGQGELPSWRDADPMFDRPAGHTAPARTAGATQATRANALADLGSASDDVRRRGRAGDDRAVAAASDQRSPDPFDWTQPRSGAAAGEGVAGPMADGLLRDGRGHGEAATRADVAQGATDLSVTAARQDPYFRDLYRQLDRLVAFPHDLAVALESGWVVGVMTVSPDGAIGGIALERSSGRDGFDGALIAALRRVSLGPVPVRLLDGHQSLRVRIPYTFRNPLVR